MKKEKDRQSERETEEETERQKERKRVVEGRIPHPKLRATFSCKS